jgi:hypothetical protein
MSRCLTTTRACCICLLLTVPTLAEQPPAQDEPPAAADKPAGATEAEEAPPTNEAASESSARSGQRAQDEQPAPEPPPTRESAAMVSPESTAPPEPQTEPPDASGALGSYQRHVQVMIGVRTSYVADDAFRLFSRTVDHIGNHYPVVQFSLGGGATLWSQQEWSLLGFGMWDYGGSSSELRGEDADIDVHRLVLGAEIRHHFVRWLYAMGRLAPAAIHTRASLDESASATTLHSRNWSFGFDASVGLGAQLFGKSDAMSRLPRGWVVAEAGYGYATANDLRFSPESDDDSAARRTDEIHLGKMAVRGPMFRISGAVTFY